MRISAKIDQVANSFGKAISAAATDYRKVAAPRVDALLPSPFPILSWTVLAPPHPRATDSTESPFPQASLTYQFLFLVSVSLQDIHMRKAFKSSVVFDQQVVSRDTMPTAMMETYNQCDTPPPLDKLNIYR